MKKVFFSFILLFIVLACFATSFKVEDKDINLIDFNGYKHEGMSTIAPMVKSLGFMEAKDVMIQNNASTPAIASENTYNDYFLIAVQPKMLFGFDISEDDFAFLREDLMESYNLNALDYNVNNILEKYGNQLTAVTEPRLVENAKDRLSFSSITQANGYNESILNICGIVLVKGKIIWVLYYCNYSSFWDYENAVSKYTRFVNSFIQANKEEVKQELPLDLHRKYLQFLMNEETQTVSSEGHPNAYGLKYTFKVPKSFVEKPSEKPHIVNQYTCSSNDSISIGMAITIDDKYSSIIKAFGQDVRISDIFENASEIVLKSYTSINSGKTTIGTSTEAFFAEYKNQQTIFDGQSVEIYYYTLTFIQDYSMVQLAFSVGGLAEDNIKDVYEMYKALFFQISSTYNPTSTIIPKSQTSPASQQLEKELFKFLATSMLIPFVTWILMALILRFGIIHHAMEKDKALLTSTVLGILVVIVLFIVAGDLGAICGTFGAFMFYVICRIGHAEYDHEQEEMKQEKERVERLYREASQKSASAQKEYTKARETQANAEDSWRKAEQARQTAEEEIQKARQESSFASAEINRLIDELNRVLERNRHLEEEVRKATYNTSANSRIVKDKRYYEQVLDLTSSYTKAELKKAYLGKVNLYHPDKVATLGPKLKEIAEEEMKDINNAYQYLQDFCI